MDLTLKCSLMEAASQAWFVQNNHNVLVLKYNILFLGALFIFVQKVLYYYCHCYQNLIIIIIIWDSHTFIVSDALCKTVTVLCYILSVHILVAIFISVLSGILQFNS